MIPVNSFRKNQSIFQEFHVGQLMNICNMDALLLLLTQFMIAMKKNVVAVDSVLDIRIICATNTRNA